MDTTIETEDYASTATTTTTTATTTQSEFSPAAANLTRRQIKQIEKDLYDNNFISARKASKMSANIADSFAGSYPDATLKDHRRAKRDPRLQSSDDPKRDLKVQYTTGTLNNDPNNEQSSSTYMFMLPISFALVPPLGAIFYGSADLWSDVLLLLLLGYYLYQIVKMPWELYYAARARRVFHDTHSLPGSTAVVENTDKELPPHLQNHRGHASATLRRQELASLVFVVASPLLGGFILDYVRAHLSPDRTYITNFNITLFVLGASIRPLTHVCNLFKKRALHLQEVVHYPATEVEQLKYRLSKMEEDLSTLKKSHATKKDLSSNLTNVVQPELNSISKTLKRVEKKEQFLRSYSEERFQYMDNKIRDFDAFVAYQLEQDAIHKQVSLPVVALRTVTGVVFLPVNVVGWMLRGVGGVLPGMGKRKAIQ